MRLLIFLFFLFWASLARADLQSNFSACQSKVEEFRVYHTCEHIFTNKDFTLGSYLYSCLQENHINPNYLEASTTTKFSSSPKPSNFPLSDIGQTFLNWQANTQFTYQGIYAEAYCEPVPPPTVFDSACRYKLKTCDASTAFPSRYCESLPYNEQLFEEGCVDKRDCNNGFIGVHSSVNPNGAPYCSCTPDYQVIDNAPWYTNCDCKYKDAMCSMVCDSYPCEPDYDEGNNDDDNNNNDDDDPDNPDDNNDDGTGADCTQSDSKISGSVKFCPDDWEMTYKEFRIMRCGALDGNCEGKDADAVICNYLGNGCNGGSYVVAPDELTNGFVIKEDEQDKVVLNRFFKPTGSNIPILDRCEADQYCTNPLSKASATTEPKECDYETAKPTLDLPCPVTPTGSELDPNTVIDTSICQNGCQYVKSGVSTGTTLCRYNLNPVTSPTSSCSSGGVSNNFPCGIDGTPPCNVRDTVTHALLGDIKTLLETLNDEVDHSLAITLSTTAIVGAIGAAALADKAAMAGQTLAIESGLLAQTVAIEAGLAAQTAALVAALRADTLKELFESSSGATKEAIERLEKTYKDSLKVSDFKPETEIEKYKLEQDKISTVIDVSTLIQLPNFSAGSCPLREKVEIPMYGGEVVIDFSYACTTLLILKILLYISTILTVQGIIFKS
ncbi:hypothetical protein BegalDRAFT_3187 [Beggiatoa alba B18LD]|uniref:Uncharacterized protein n=1 Tax=Beggiatoa alba B18LD TaxID=395493 RepID=I3CK68_9GAMM|nr:hypothetical protein [Beggiatoa alba]EIJ44011.1 hypothetical protein BegalDRAFT_3187 [Beggiatoa alba B18LD]